MDCGLQSGEIAHKRVHFYYLKQQHKQTKNRNLARIDLQPIGFSGELCSRGEGSKCRDFEQKIRYSAELSLMCNVFVVD